MLRPVLLIALCAVACASPAPPPSHLARLWPAGQGDSMEPILGLSTEDGLLVLAEPHYRVGDLFEIQFPFGDGVVQDFGRLQRLNEDLAVVQPITSRLMEGRIAARLPEEDETIYLALRTGDDKPDMVSVDLWEGGRMGDFIEAPGNARRLARDYAGTGLYVQRENRWQIVGILAGITASVRGESELGLGFIGLHEMTRILPHEDDYFRRPIRPLRPDFEFGLPLQPGDIELPEENAAEGTP